MPGISDISYSKIFFLSTFQAALLFGLVCWLSYLVIPRTDLTLFPIDITLKNSIFPGLIAGLLVGGTLYLLRIVFSSHTQKRLMFLWSTNLLVAIVFGLGHLPTVFELTIPSSLEVFRILFLNGIPSIVFGYIYWTRGLLAPMSAHFVTDIVIHAFLI